MFLIVAGGVRKKIVLCFLLGNSSASEFYMPTFRNTLSVPFYIYVPMKMEQTECSETSAYKIQKPGNYPEKKHKTIRTRRKFEIKRNKIIDIYLFIYLLQFGFHPVAVVGRLVQK